ncbi:Tat pathway signal sequence domain protein [Streptomyces sp. NPDC006879]|uniref:Tat pathway signal sequence domain protein n=1 Tax=Streptomyces sp. NPDC006879 TaxID=3364767 RepID=UPI0036ACBE15
MYITVRRHLGKMLAGAAIAVTGTAFMVGVTLPGAAGADDGGSGGSAAGVASRGAAAVPIAQPGVAEPPPVERENGSGRDPLTEAERDKVRRLALGPDATEGRNAVGGRGPQWITSNLAELTPQEVARGGRVDRRAHVSFYDYQRDALVTKTVNLRTGEVVKTDTQRETQPPVVVEEAVEAAKLMIASPAGEGLRKDYRDATSRKLTGPSQLSLQNALVYRVSAQNPGPDELKQCGKQRCVRLFLKVKNGPWIDVRSLVVNLSARTVHQL